MLKPLSALPADAADFELAFFNALFREVPGGPLRDRDLGETDENLGDAVEDAKTLLRKSLTGDRTLVKHSGQAFVLSALPLVLVAAAIAVGSEVSYTYNLVAGAAIAVVALLIALFRFYWHRSGDSVAMAVITVAATVFEAGMVIYACADYLLLPEGLVDSMRDDEVYEAAKQLAVPYDLAKYVHDNGRLPVVAYLSWPSSNPVPRTRPIAWPCSASSGACKSSSARPSCRD